MTEHDKGNMPASKCGDKKWWWPKEVFFNIVDERKQIDGENSDRLRIGKMYM